jgi:hypothetical protein
MASDDSEDKSNFLEVIGGTELLFSQDVYSLTKEQQVGAWTILDLLEKVSKERKEAFRKEMLSLARDGEKDEKGSGTVVINGTTVVAEARTPDFPDEKKLKEILKAKKLPLDSCFDQVTAYQLNPSKLEFLVDQGKLSQEEVDSCRETTYALKVKPEKETKDKLNEIKHKLSGKKKW